MSGNKLQLSDAPRKTMALLLALTTALGSTALPAFAASKTAKAATAVPATATPIQHLVVIFQENVSFDHYFGTYPSALNPAGEPKFTGAANTPTVNGLNNPLLNRNPHLNQRRPGDEVSGGPDGSLQVPGDPDPIGDVCSNSTRNQVTMGSHNIGDLLSAAGVTWGSFMGGFNLSIVNPNGTAGCSRSSANAVNGVATKDYIPHHSFFNYWTSTSNAAHTPPASVAEIGSAGPPTNRYDFLTSF